MTFMTFIRSLLFSIYFFTLTLFMGLFAFYIRYFAKKHALAYAQLWTELSIKGLTKICKIEIDIKGNEFLPNDSSFIIASQHQSAFDTLIWMNLLPRPAYIMKKELIHLPLVGPMLLLSGMIPLDRQGGARALKNLVMNCKNAIKDQRQIIIFPEGTRSQYGKKVKLQAGVAAIASQLDLKIVPVSTNSGLHWGRHSFLKKPGTIYINLHPVITDLSNRKKVLFAIEKSWDNNIM